MLKKLDRLSALKHAVQLLGAFFYFLRLRVKLFTENSVMVRLRVILSLGVSHPQYTNLD